jgi:dynein heavy chain
MDSVMVTPQNQLNPQTKDASAKPQSGEQLQKRLDVLVDSIQFSVFNYIRRGLFERDKLTIITQLCLWVLQKDGKVENAEIQKLVVGARKDTGLQMPTTVSKWLPQRAWLKLQSLKELPAFASLADDIVNFPEWKD